VDLDLIDQAGTDELLPDARAAHHGDVLAPAAAVARARARWMPSVTNE
jgi:hypothetical protein